MFNHVYILNTSRSVDNNVHFDERNNINILKDINCIIILNEINDNNCNTVILFSASKTSSILQFFK